jgi:hypothetical protein
MKTGRSHSENPKHGAHTGHNHMREILDGDHEKSVKHRGSAKLGIGGLAAVHVPHGDTRREVFKHGGRAKKR